MGLQIVGTKFHGVSSSSKLKFISNIEIKFIKLKKSWNFQILIFHTFYSEDFTPAFTIYQQ